MVSIDMICQWLEAEADQAFNSLDILTRQLTFIIRYKTYNCCGIVEHTRADRKLQQIKQKMEDTALYAVLCLERARELAESGIPVPAYGLVIDLELISGLDWNNRPIFCKRQVWSRESPLDVKISGRLSLHMKPVWALTNEEILEHNAQSVRAHNARVASWVYNDKLRAAEALLPRDEREARQQLRREAARKYREELHMPKKKCRQQAAKDPSHQERLRQRREQRRLKKAGGAQSETVSSQPDADVPRFPNSLVEAYVSDAE
ncbi:hypothetical protein DFH07DRAFT_773649 [Mycena maculata]|uniref:Uncharacterized protein n=1 Tax=Mycena maculata TaxID=230809 RepID=A0AAD7J151_9AGAR|nr:hypothetical protein DFH07DRAFT_773649 [Mycena maculata]